MLGAPESEHLTVVFGHPTLTLQHGVYKRGMYGLSTPHNHTNRCLLLLLRLTRSGATWRRTSTTRTRLQCCCRFGPAHGLSRRRKGHRCSHLTRHLPSQRSTAQSQSSAQSQLWTMGKCPHSRASAFDVKLVHILVKHVLQRCDAGISGCIYV